MLRYADASAKIPSGMMSGNLVDFGAFDQCLALDQTENNIRYRGKYCIMSVPIPPELLSFGDIIPTGDKQNKVNEIEDRVLLGIQAMGGLGLILGWCIPDKCAPENVTNVMTQLLQLTPLKNMTIHPYLGGMCQTKEGMENETSTFSATDLGAMYKMARYINSILFSYLIYIAELS